MPPPVWTKQGKIVAKLLPTEVTVSYQPYYVFLQNKATWLSEARLRDVCTCEVPQQKSLKSVYNLECLWAKQHQKRKEEELQRSFANCLRRSAVKMVSLGRESPVSFFPG